MTTFELGNGNTSNLHERSADVWAATSLLNKADIQERLILLVDNGLCINLASSGYIGQSSPHNTSREALQIIPSEPVSSSKKSTAAALLVHAGTWEGNDLSTLLSDVYASRGKVRL